MSNSTPEEGLGVRASELNSLPDWAFWFIELGRWLSGAESPDGLVRVALSVPHRAYVAAFAATGVVLGACAERGVPDAQEHFEYLESIESGTQVRYRQGESNTVSFATILPAEKVFTQDGTLCLARSHVCLSDNYKREARQSVFIEPLPADCGSPVREREICENPSFVKSAARLITRMPKFDEYEHGFRQRVDCVIVGTKSTLANELSLNLQAEGHSGTIQDLVRADDWLHPVDGYRCRIVSTHREPDPDRAFGHASETVIFDGANAVLRWLDTAWEHPWLAIIDRTSPTADSARNAIVADLATSLEDLDPPIEKIPPGVELISYVT